MRAPSIEHPALTPSVRTLISVTTLFGEQKKWLTCCWMGLPNGRSAQWSVNVSCLRPPGEEGRFWVSTPAELRDRYGGALLGPKVVGFQ